MHHPTRRPPGDDPSPGSDPTRPLWVTPAGPWDQVRARLADRGTVVVYGRLEEWRPGDLAESRLRELLGRDYERFRAFTHPRVQGSFLAARLLMRHAAAAVIETRPELLDLAYRHGGRPYIRGLDQVDISLSHTGRLMVVGMTSRGSLGVDVEVAERQLLATGIEEQVCTPFERETLGALPDDKRNAAMVQLWTLKEAYSKAIGQGLRFPFNEFGFHADDPAAGLLRPDGTPGTGPEWTFSTCRVEDEFAVSVALHDHGFGGSSDVAARSVQDDGLFAVMQGLREARAAMR